MSLFGTIYLGKSGVTSMSRGISISADNVANLESTGFRANRPLFEDLFLSATTEAPPLDQKGLGTDLEAVEILYQEGPIRATDNPTDLAISGKGFFTVTDRKNFFFTRDGGFLLQEAAKEGYLKLATPSGYELCGWEIPEGMEGQDVTSGTLAPILIPKNMSGKATSEIVLQLNCDSSKPPEGENLTLLDKWDSSHPEEPLGEGNYDLKVDLPLWDDLGTQHHVSLYIDRTAEPRTFEFLVALNPSEDWRGDGPYSGCLLSGLLHFGSAGQLESITNVQTISPDGTATELPPEDWPGGFPAFTVNFTGTPQQITLDFGLQYESETGSWNRLEDHASTAYAAPFSVVYQHLDGYPSGRFQEINVDEKGVVRAQYTNQQTLEVARLPLALFGSADDLERAGGNLFQAVNGAEPEYFAPGKDAPGSIMGGALEGSNVDLANEMVHLITLQRAFQSNTRVITTADQMLDDFIRAV